MSKILEYQKFWHVIKSRHEQSCQNLIVCIKGASVSVCNVWWCFVNWLVVYRLSHVYCNKRSNFRKKPIRNKVKGINLIEISLKYLYWWRDRKQNVLGRPFNAVEYIYAPNVQYAKLTKSFTWKLSTKKFGRVISKKWIWKTFKYFVNGQITWNFTTILLKSSFYPVFVSLVYRRLLTWPCGWKIYLFRDFGSPSMAAKIIQGYIVVIGYDH